MLVTNRGLELSYANSSLVYSIPKGTPCIKVGGADDALFAIAAAAASKLTNPHDAKYGYLWVPVDAVEERRNS